MAPSWELSEPVALLALLSLADKVGRKGWHRLWEAGPSGCRSDSGEGCRRQLAKMATVVGGELA